MNNDVISNQYLSMVDATNVVSKSDLNGVITYVNSKFIEISGYSREELIGQPHNILRDPTLSSSIFRDLWSTIKSKKPWKGVISNIRKDGKKYTVEASIFPILNANKEVVEYISIRHDISELIDLNKQVSKLHNDRIEQEQIAKNKFESGIVNDMTQEECQVLYHPTDTLSGDFYSIYKREDGSIFMYLLDGQGHGISAALTVFAVSSMISQTIYEIETLEEIMEKLSPSLQNFLGDEEQLSYTMIMINKDKKNIAYSSAGMYPFLIKKGEEYLKIKANNTPFMNFSPTPKVEKKSISNMNSIMMYSDGIIEHENREVLEYLPKKLIFKPSHITKAFQEISSHRFEDDVTLVHLQI